MTRATRGFNPLHCGAVVASGGEPGAGIPIWPCFNPLHCGAVVASGTAARKGLRPQVSIPFIAGQWSLLERPLAARRGARRVSIPFIAGQWSLRVSPMKTNKKDDVSIPFIAGQWSLPAVVAAWREAAARFQSPSLRGSGRFGGRARTTGSGRPRFNPLHCGAVVASGRLRHRLARAGRVFQSPSLRGSGRFEEKRGKWQQSAGSFNPLHCGAVVASTSLSRWPGCGLKFQSPSLRGSGRFIKLAAGWDGSPKVSIPFIAGQWSLRAQARAQAEVEARFNPLHCGAVVASSARSSTR